MSLNWKDNYWIREKGFAVGDKVKILPKIERTETEDWEFDWVYGMDEMIGKVGKIAEIEKKNHKKAVIDEKVDAKDIYHLLVRFTDKDKSCAFFPAWQVRRVY